MLSTPGKLPAPCRSGASCELRRTDDRMQVDHQQARDARTRYLLGDENDVAEHLGTIDFPTKDQDAVFVLYSGTREIPTMYVI